MVRGTCSIAAVNFEPVDRPEERRPRPVSINFRIAFGKALRSPLFRGFCTRDVDFLWGFYRFGEHDDVIFQDVDKAAAGCKSFILPRGIADLHLADADGCKHRRMVVQDLKTAHDSRCAETLDLAVKDDFFRGNDLEQICFLRHRNYAAVSFLWRSTTSSIVPTM